MLNERPDAPERLDHLGVEVFTAEEVTATAERLRANGMISLVEQDTTCCCANADKVWAKEPDGLRWEWYRVLGDSETFGGTPAFEDATGATADSEVDNTKRSCC
ncbi:MAG: hypothetical protein ACI9BW_001457 [Gammaproteobacteria bacterium]